MNLNRDEIRRQLRASEAEQRATLPRFTRAVRRAFDPTSGTPLVDRLELVGLPRSRRAFLQLSGATVVGGVVLAACGDVRDTGVQHTGSLPPGGQQALTVEPSEELDLTLLLTAGSVEALAIDTYETVLERGLLDDPALDEAVALFRDHHQEHLSVVGDAVSELGGEPYEEPNPYLEANVVQPAIVALEALPAEEVVAATLGLAYTLENTAMQSYTRYTGVLTEADLRQTAMSIGGIEARHVAVILSALREPAVPFTFAPIGAAAPEDAYITEDGPVNVPTTTTVAPAEDGDEQG